MQFVFLRGDTALVMPVTPQGYEFYRGHNIETINISQVGDVYRAGGRCLWQDTWPFMLPAQEYPFMEPGAVADPQHYLDQLNAWQDKKPVRLIITETQINVAVVIERVLEREQDGTGDRYVDISMREWTDLAAAEVTDPNAAATGNLPRSDTEQTTEQSYDIKPGDTMAMICRRYYGKSTAKYYNALATYNSIPNPNVIRAGKTIRIPPESVLFGGGKA